MKRYESNKTSQKSIKDKTMVVGTRFGGQRDHGSTHRNPTKKRIVRVGKKRARREAKKQIMEE